MACPKKHTEVVAFKQKINQLLKENPDLSYEFIKNILIAQQEAKAGKLKAYQSKKKCLKF